MMHWSCETCLVRAMCTTACEKVERHNRMSRVGLRYGNVWVNVMAKHLAKTSPLSPYYKKGREISWITS